MSHPALMHERIAAQARELLDEALNDDLAAKKRSALTLLRIELDASKRLQMLCGQAAPWSVWRAAFERVQAEIDRRPA